MHPLVKDMTGKKIGSLTPILYVGGKGGKWLCECECGNETEIPSYNLRRTDRPTLSCGKCNYPRSKKHNHTTETWKSPTYSSWDHMKQRVKGNHKYYKDVDMCESWLKFDNFLADMGERPSEDYLLHRIDNSKGYHPDNCEWKLKSQHISDHNKAYQKKHGKNKFGR